MFIRYLPVIFVFIALVLALAPLETAGQSPGPSASDKGRAQAQGVRKAAKLRPGPAGAPVKVDARQVRPAQALPPERIAPSNIRALDAAEASPARKDDPRSVEERADPGG